MKIEKTITEKLEKSYKTPFNLTLNKGVPFKAHMDGNGTVSITTFTDDHIELRIFFVKGDSIIIQ